MKLLLRLKLAFRSRFRAEKPLVLEGATRFLGNETVDGHPKSATPNLKLLQNLSPTTHVRISDREQNHRNFRTTALGPNVLVVAGRRKRQREFATRGGPHRETLEDHSG